MLVMDLPLLSTSPDGKTSCWYVGQASSQNLMLPFQAPSFIVGGVYWTANGDYNVEVNFAGQ